MPKLTGVAILAVVAACTHGMPAVSENDLASAAAAGNWDEVHRLLGSYKQKYELPPLNMNTMNVKDYKPPPGSHFFGEVEYAYHAATNDNGRVQEESGGHKVINHDGKVTEYDFKPARSKF